MKSKSAVQVLVSIILCLSVLCYPAFADDVAGDEDYWEDIGLWDDMLNDSFMFSDVSPDSDFFSAIESLAGLGIINGYDDGTFRPEGTITRAEAATLICRMLGVEHEAEMITKQVFDDVPQNHWAAGYVAKAVELGIVNGVGNNLFAPNNHLTEEQIVAMLIRANGYEPKPANSDNWALGYIIKASEIGIISDISLIRNVAAKRETVAQLIYNSINL